VITCPVFFSCLAKFHDHRLVPHHTFNGGLGHSSVLDVAGFDSDASGNCHHAFISLKVTNVSSAAASPNSRIHPRAWPGQEAVRGFRSIISNDSVNDPIDAALRQTLGRPSKADSTVFRTIENCRSELRHCTDSFESEERGAGYHDNIVPKDQKNTGIAENITVSEAASWSQDRIHGRLCTT
jgi:hypothetical protein